MSNAVLLSHVMTNAAQRAQIAGDVAGAARLRVYAASISADEELTDEETRDAHALSQLHTDIKPGA